MCVILAIINQPYIPLNPHLSWSNHYFLMVRLQTGASPKISIPGEISLSVFQLILAHWDFNGRPHRYCESTHVGLEPLVLPADVDGAKPTSGCRTQWVVSGLRVTFNLSGVYPIHNYIIGLYCYDFLRINNLRTEHIQVTLDSWWMKPYILFFGRSWGVYYGYNHGIIAYRAPKLFFFHEAN